MLTFIYGLIRGIFAVLDKIVASLIEMLFDLMLSIADIDLFGNSTAVETLANNITILLGVFMLFKLSFSFLNYIINPDQFTDKSKGFAKIIQNVLITLVLLTSYNFIFDKAMYFQGIFLKENTVGRIILGGYGTGVIEVKSQARTVSFSVFSAFIQPSNTIRYVCNGYATIARQNGEAWNNCKNVLKNYDDDVTKYMNRDGTYYTIENQVQEIAKYDDTAGLLDNILRAKNGDEFAFDYMFFISGICGIFVAILLVNFCFDIAIRTIKLAFLRLMAPIPIISYIDPIKGEGIFKKWLTNVGKTYLDLFVRLMAIYFAIFIINVTMEVLGNGVSTYSGSTTASSNPLVMIFIIIGALMFAKQFPKLIQDITGINLGDGKFKLNPLKRISEDAVGGSIMKKPAEMLGRLPGAPFRALGTGAKKLAVGTDSAIHGQGFRKGSKSVQGNFSKGYQKLLDNWAPASGEARKNRKAGKEEVSAMHDKWTAGAKTLDKLKKDFGTTNPFTLFDGQNEAAYKSAYKSSEFRRSRMELDKKDEANKALNRISEATMRGERLEDALMAEASNLKKYDKSTYDKFFDTNGSIISHKPDGTILSSSERMNSFVKSREDTQKAVAGMEKVHESLRKQNQADANTEDAIKFVKYNKTDPSDPSRIYSTSSTVSGTPSVTASGTASGTPSVTTSGTASGTPSVTTSGTASGITQYGEKVTSNGDGTYTTKGGIILASESVSSSPEGPVYKPSSTSGSSSTIIQTPQQPKTTSPERIKEYDRVISELNSLMSKERDPKIKAEINEAISRYTKEKNNIK